jgi:kexin
VPFNHDDPDWQTTFTGRRFSHKFGYGKLDTLRLVETAKSFKSVGPRTMFSTPELVRNGPIVLPHGHEGVKLSFVVTESMLEKENFKSLEHVTVTVSFEHQNRGDVEVFLISPHGIISILATPRPNDRSDKGLKDWRFMTVKHWEENPLGEWTVHVVDRVNPILNGKLTACSIQFHGEVKDASSKINTAVKPEVGSTPKLPTDVMESSHLGLKLFLSFVVAAALIGGFVVLKKKGYFELLMRRLKHGTQDHVPLPNPASSGDVSSPIHSTTATTKDVLSDTFGGTFLEDNEELELESLNDDKPVHNATS